MTSLSIYHDTPIHLMDISMGSSLAGYRAIAKEGGAPLSFTIDDLCRATSTPVFLTLVSSTAGAAKMYWGAE